MCTQPVGMCNHKNQFGLDVIRNWHYGFCDCFESLGVTIKTFCCCCCCIQVKKYSRDSSR